jgi:very-short-patch-repair endonuclease
MKYPEIVSRVRELRKNMTQSEKLLWEKLRNKKFHGAKFLRQHPVFYQRDFTDHRFFIVDFYCAKFKLAIELDGKIHDQQQEYDEWREEIIAANNIKVIRIKNEELQNISQVLKKIEKEMGL